MVRVTFLILYCIITLARAKNIPDLLGITALVYAYHELENLELLFEDFNIFGDYDVFGDIRIFLLINCITLCFFFY